MPAPILVTVYNRFDHFQKCIESLQRNDLAPESVLYISSDGAYRKEDETSISEIRHFCRSITGFKEIVCLFQERNKGLVKCYYESMELILKKNDRLVFLEDDIIVSLDFLEFINDGLDFYKTNKHIFSISAFSFSIFFDPNINDNRIYFTNRPSAWGCGLWKDKFVKETDYSIRDVKLSLKDRFFVKKLDSIGLDLYPSFVSILNQGKMITLDYLTTYHMVKNKLYTVSPYISKSFNIGNDGSGSRTSKSKRFEKVDTSFLMNKHEFCFSNEIINNINNCYYKKFYDTKFQKTKRLLLKLGLLDYAMMLKQ